MLGRELKMAEWLFEQLKFLPFWQHKGTYYAQNYAGIIASGLLPAEQVLTMTTQHSVTTQLKSQTTYILLQTTVPLKWCEGMRSAKILLAKPGGVEKYYFST